MLNIAGFAVGVADEAVGVIGVDRKAVTTAATASPMANKPRFIPLPPAGAGDRG